MDRARSATQALQRAFDGAADGTTDGATDGTTDGTTDGATDGKADDTRIVRTAEAATIFVGKTPIIELDADDAAAAGSASLDVYAADVSAKVRAAVVQERRRNAIANTVFSFALVVFTGLLAFLLLGKATDFAARGHDWVEDNPHRVPSLRVGRIELLHASVVESVATIGIDVGKRLVQFGALYAWALFSFSLFQATRPLTERLTGLVLGPVSTLFVRVGTGLPLALAAALALFAIVLLVRFAGLFFAGVARGETSLDWVPRDLAAPVSALVRIGIVVGGLVLAAPLLTGVDEGVLARVGIATLLALGLAATPVLACAVVGTIVVFGRRLRPGDVVELAGRSGRVREVSLMELIVEDEAGAAVRVPHLLSLVHPTRIVGPVAIVRVEIVVDAAAPHAKVRALLLEVASRAGAAPNVELTSLDADGAIYRVTLGAAPDRALATPPMKRVRSSARHTVVPGGPSLPPVVDPRASPSASPRTSGAQLLVLLADALAQAGILLGRRSHGLVSHGLASHGQVSHAVASSDGSSTR